MGMQQDDHISHHLQQRQDLCTLGNIYMKRQSDMFEKNPKMLLHVLERECHPGFLKFMNISIQEM